MSEPIISPFWIWLIGTVDTVKGLSALFTIIFFIPLTISFGVYLLADKDDIKAKERFFKIVLVTFPFLFLTTFIAVFTPNSKTLIAMLVANEITYERVDVAKDTLKDIRQAVKDDIIFILKNAKCGVEK